jgi:hypothetical protein
MFSSVVSSLPRAPLFFLLGPRSAHILSRQAGGVSKSHIEAEQRRASMIDHVYLPSLAQGVIGRLTNGDACDLGVAPGQDMGRGPPRTGLARGCLCPMFTFPSGIWRKADFWRRETFLAFVFALGTSGGYRRPGVAILVGWGPASEVICMQDMLNCVKPFHSDRRDRHVPVLLPPGGGGDQTFEVPPMPMNRISAYRTTYVSSASGDFRDE